MDRQPAPDFTRAFLVSLAPLVLLGLVTIWVLWGLIAAVATGFAADRTITGAARR